MKGKALILSCIVLIVSLAFAGCTPALQMKDIPSAAAPETASAATTAPASPSPTAFTGERYGWIQKAYTKDGVDLIDIRFVEFFMGDEAVAEAKKDGALNENDEGEGSTEYTWDDNGKLVWYYMRENNDRIETFPLDAKCRISAYKDDAAEGGLIETACSPELNNKLMHVTMQNGVVVSMHEHYMA